MGELYIPGEKKINGPWLLGTQELEELDEIFELIDQQIMVSVKSEIEETAKVETEKGQYKNLEDAKQQIQKYYFKIEDKIKTVTLISKDEKRLHDKTIKGILKDPKLQDFEPKDLKLNIRYRYTNEFTFSLSKRFDGELNYKGKCFDPNCENEIKYRIETWIEKNKPSRIKQLWLEYNIFFILFSICSMILTLPFIVTSELPDFQSGYKKEINQIIRSGVDKENQTKAIELLLKYNTDYIPENVHSIQKINWLMVKLFCIELFILLIFIFPPKTTLGIGKHKSLLNFYKVYSTTVLITLPTVFFVTPMYEWLKKVLGL